HHVVARSDVMNADGDANLDSGSDDCFIQDLAATSHIGDRFAKAITASSTGLPEHNCAPWSVLRDCPGAFGGGRCCGGLRDLSPRERGHSCQGYGQEHFFHDFPFFVLLMAISPLYSGSRFWPNEEPTAILDSHPRWTADVFNKSFYSA